MARFIADGMTFPWPWISCIMAYFLFCFGKLSIDNHGYRCILDASDIFPKLTVDEDKNYNSQNSLRCVQSLMFNRISHQLFSERLPCRSMMYSAPLLRMPRFSVTKMRSGAGCISKVTAMLVTTTADLYSLIEFLPWSAVLNDFLV